MMDSNNGKRLGNPSFGEFTHAYKNSKEYPFTLQLPFLSNDVLEDYHKLLQVHAQRLFGKPDLSRITLWEYLAGDLEFSEEEEVDDSQELHDHLQERNEKDVLCRHVFINACHSRSPLHCSEELFKKLLTFHQVPPFFLDDLITFGKQRDQLDVSLSRFTDHNAYYMHHNGSALPQLDRSGNELRHSFLLRSAERADPTNPDPWQWRTRPCAVYHSFDLVTGKAVWITTKADDAVQRRIMGNSRNFEALYSSVVNSTRDILDVPRLLEATLATHLVYFRWCEDSWRWFIRDIDQCLTDKAEKGRLMPVDRRPYETNLPGRKETGLSSPTTAEFPSNTGDQVKGGYLSLLRRMRSCGRRTASRLVVCPEQTGGPDVIHDEAFVLGEFNCKDLQTLGTIHRRLEEARRTCKLNRQALDDICQYYTEIAQYYPSEISSHEEKAISQSISQFVRKVKAITQSFERSEEQLTSLRTIVAESDIPLLESILQLRGSYASRMFAEAAHGMSAFMASISWWGYIIALLVFIPFYSTATTGLLQSPIFECQADTGSCLVNQAALSLFFEIAGPLTALGLIVFWCLKARARVRTESSLV
ncbi:hypothetical protein V8F33_007862 [Rhypophila sp. PSN 637]